MNSSQLRLHTNLHINKSQQPHPTATQPQSREYWCTRDQRYRRSQRKSKALTPYQTYPSPSLLTQYRPLIAIARSLRACSSSINAMMSFTLRDYISLSPHTPTERTASSAFTYSNLRMYWSHFVNLFRFSAPTSTFFASISGRTRFSLVGTRAKKAPGRMSGCSSSSVPFYHSSHHHYSTSLLTRVERIPVEVPTAITFPGYT